MSFFLFKQKTAYEMRISDWSSDVCSSDLTDEQWMQRIGHVGSVFGTGKNQTAVPNAGKILYGAFKDSWKTSHDQFTKLAFERGYMNQEVAELERQFSAIKTPGAMRSFLKVIPITGLYSERSEEHTSELQSLMRNAYA